MILVHKHLLLKAEVHKPIVNEKRATIFLERLISEINMKTMFGPVARYCNMKGNKGVTAIAIIETSHVAIHVWDEQSPALLQLDVYTCSDLDKELVFESLKQFNPVKTNYKYLDREKELKLV